MACLNTFVTNSGKVIGLYQRKDPDFPYMVASGEKYKIPIAECDSLNEATRFFDNAIYSEMELIHVAVL